MMRAISFSSRGSSENSKISRTLLSHSSMAIYRKEICQRSAPEGLLQRESRGTYENLVSLSIATVVLNHVGVLGLLQKGDLDHEVLRYLVLIRSDNLDGHCLASGNVLSLINKVSRQLGARSVSTIPIARDLCRTQRGA